MKQENMAFLKRRKTKISGSQMYGAIGLGIGHKHHVLRRKKSDNTFRRVLSTKAMNFWLSLCLKFDKEMEGCTLEKTLYQICCGLLRLLKEADRAEVNILSIPVFCSFHAHWMLK